MKERLLKTLQVALKKLAIATIRRYKPAVIGVTGSVGKTSTKQTVYTVINNDRRVRTSAENFNNELGMPLTILGNWNHTGGVFFWLKVLIKSVFQLVVKTSYPELLILEYAADRPGDIDYLLDIVKPQISIVTAVGEKPVHVEFYSGPEAVAKEKAKLVECLKSDEVAILNVDDTSVFAMKEKTKARVFTYGFSEGADMRIINFETHTSEKSAPDGISFKLENGGSTVPIRIKNALGKSQAYAAAAAASVGLLFGFNLVKISEKLSHYKSEKGRATSIQGIKGSYIIDDTYNASPLAVKSALEILSELKAERRIAVLANMAEMGRFSDKAHEEVGAAAAKVADILVTVGDKARLIAEGARKAGAGIAKSNIVSCGNSEEATNFFKRTVRKGDMILIKGSQSTRMEKVVKELMLKPSDAKDLLVRQYGKWLKS